MWRTLDVSCLCLVAAATLRAVAVIPTPRPRGMTETCLFLKETKNMCAEWVVLLYLREWVVLLYPVSNDANLQDAN